MNNMIVFILVILYCTKEISSFSFIKFQGPLSKRCSIIYNQKAAALYLKKKTISDSSTTRTMKPYTQMIPIPYDISEENEDNFYNFYDDFDGLFDAQSYGSENIIQNTISIANSFERDYDVPTTVLLRTIFESPLDSPASVRFKNVVRSIILLFLLLGTTFTTSYYVFPGSFLHYTAIGQFHPKYTTLLPTFSPFEQAEFSESGGVVS